MSLTACGPVCDVGGEYILPIKQILGIEPTEQIHQFSVTGSGILYCCDDHLEVLKEAGVKHNVSHLPDGPLRRAYEADLEVRSCPAGRGGEWVG